MRGIIAILVIAVAGCRPTATGSTPPYEVDATVREIMDAMIDPAADRLWNSVGTTFTEQGAEVREPRTEADWQELRRRTIHLIEGANLLMMPGRRVAPPGAATEHPEVERSPEQIQAAIAGDPRGWSDLARGLQATARPILQAIDARSTARLIEANSALDRACENCHLKYWYPGDALARQLNQQ